MDGPRLFEAVMEDAEMKPVIADIVERAKSNPYINAVMREGLLSDAAAALGRMHNVVIEAAKPALISREIIWTLSTKEALVRFPKAKLGKAKITAEGAELWIHGEKYETTDVKTDVEIRAGAEYTKKFFEDASWFVLERQTAEVGRAVAELETEKVYGYLAANAGTATTGDNDGILEWAEVVKLWGELKKLNYNPNILIISPEEAADLWTQDQFIHSFYFGEQADVQRGVLGTSYLGMKIIVSSKCTANQALAIDTSVAAVMLIRRDILTEPFENPREDRYGVVASERIGLGTLRAVAIAKMTNI